MTDTGSSTIRAKEATLSGAKVLVTGGARGVGATIATEVVALGGEVVLGDINEAGVRATAAAINETSGRTSATAVALDVSDAGSWESAVTAASGAMDGLSALVNDAAILTLGPLETTDPALIEQLLSVNLLGPTLGVRAVTAALRDNGGGSIVNIASVAGLEGRNATVAYTASKWGVRGLTRASAMELGLYGIRVNAVCPSMGNPEMFAPFMEQFEYDDFIRTSTEPALVIDRTARDVDMTDVAAMVTWLLSPAAQACTGADFVVDAGWTAGIHVSGMPGWELERDWRGPSAG